MSLLSIILCGALLFGVFSAQSFRNTALADVKLSGVTGRIQKISEDFLEAINREKDGEEPREITENQYEKVYLGGYPVGLKLYADGVIVVGTESVDTSTGEVNPAAVAGLKTGDISQNYDLKLSFIIVTDNSILCGRNGGEELLPGNVRSLTDLGGQIAVEALRLHCRHSRLEVQIPFKKIAELTAGINAAVALIILNMDLSRTGADYLAPIFGGGEGYHITQIEIKGEHVAS